jgi:hypothetical protein
MLSLPIHGIAQVDRGEAVGLNIITVIAMGAHAFDIGISF